MFSKSIEQYTERQFRLLRGIASQVSVAVANILSKEKLVLRENEKSMLLSLSGDITSCRNREDVQEIIASKLAGYFGHHDLMICLNNDDGITHSAYVSSVCDTTRNHPEFSAGAELKFFINDGIFNHIEAATDPLQFDMDDLLLRSNKPYYVDFWHTLGVKEILGFPMRVNNECIGAATLYPRRRNALTTPELNIIQAICSYLGIALANIRSMEMMNSQLEEVSRHKFRLEEENQYLQDQIKNTYNYNEVIGSRNGLKEVFRMITNVAASDSTVLLMGETGTGKELIASAIHDLSPRKDKLMIKVNCAALPANLVESELFGHEKGSFTGATERRIGKFELANNSTLFLDEIGEMPLDLQVKLLRALQEKEIERLGGKTTIKTNVRIIAATNRNLQQAVHEGKFRMDLFYRLNVFPIALPPLRERTEDIPLLVSHFIRKLSAKLGKQITNISPGAVKTLTIYNWPGNVRELEHIIERSMLMTNGTVIEEIYLPNDNPVAVMHHEYGIKSLEENERDYILYVLKKSQGKVRGTGGAAEILGIPPTTLHSKMKKLGIKRGHV